jgi:tetratricopeptide (TPR) repeat protein
MAQTMLRDYLQQTEDAISSGRINDALANCQHILTQFPDSLEAQRLLGEVYLAQGHLKDAQQTFDWVLTSDPENVVVYCDRALISEQMSDYDTALDCYQQAYELSRGNGQIRQEFNQLSTKVGQPHFMFSRAGLARLYMRGDLLLQAIQEWETVLNATPDRLDARLGLLETLWREGLNERVEQTAKQILQDVPTCLKAILLLAYTSYSHNPAQARELIRQAEALDPELIMAQDLFSDLLARQPNDPFLILIKKAPTILPDIVLNTQSTTATNGSANDYMQTNSASSISPSSEPLFRWGAFDANVKPQEDLQEAPEYNIWSSSDLQVFDSKKSESNDTELPTPPAWLDILTHGDQRPANEEESSAPPLPSIEQEPSEVDDVPLMSSAPEVEAKALQEEIPQTNPISPIPFTPDDSDAANWPEWLKSLGAAEMEDGSIAEVPATQLEQLPNVQSMVEEQASEPAEQLPSPLWSDQEAEPAEHEMPPAWIDQMADTFTQQSPSHDQLDEPMAQEESEEPPAWMDQVAAPNSQQPPSPLWSDQPDEPSAPQAPAWMDQLTIPFTQQSPQEMSEQLPEPPVQEDSPGWMNQLDEPSSPHELPAMIGEETTPLPEPEQQVVTTLENLEQSLHSQGFVELAPRSLSTIAQSTEEPSLFSALAQLGNFAPSFPPQSTTPIQDTPPEPPSVTPTAQPFQPSWFAAAPLQPVSEPVPYTPGQISPSYSAEPSVIPPYRADALLENELETTMKRPAIRLQPMQQHPATQRDVTPIIGQTRTPDRPVSSGTTESNLTPRERLLRGYQHQLTGDYDEAMQEYRIIIRSTSEFLGEVISNVRALLKLAPKYSAGYRVLGDAYMRQGEYLQAMEAYNKALSMTKKAKGV